MICCLRSLHTANPRHFRISQPNVSVESRTGPYLDDFGQHLVVVIGSRRVLVLRIDRDRVPIGTKAMSDSEYYAGDVRDAELDAQKMAEPGETFLPIDWLKIL